MENATCTHIVFCSYKNIFHVDARKDLCRFDARSPLVLVVVQCTSVDNIMAMVVVFFLKLHTLWHFLSVARMMVTIWMRWNENEGGEICMLSMKLSQRYRLCAISVCNERMKITSTTNTLEWVKWAWFVVKHRCDLFS